MCLVFVFVSVFAVYVGVLCRCSCSCRRLRSCCRQFVWFVVGVCVLVVRIV